MKKRDATAANFAKKSLLLKDEISEVLAGHKSEVIGAALADILSMWLAGHHPRLRESLLNMHIDFVQQHIPLSDAQIRREHPEECREWPACI